MTEKNYTLLINVIIDIDLFVAWWWRTIHINLIDCNDSLIMSEKLSMLQGLYCLLTFSHNNNFIPDKNH